jgi:hypothetical protein
VLATAVKVLLAMTAVPLAALFAVRALVAGNASLGVMVFGVVLAAGGVLIELLTLSLRAVPGWRVAQARQLRHLVYDATEAPATTTLDVSLVRIQRT